MYKDNERMTERKKDGRRKEGQKQKKMEIQKDRNK